MLHGHGTFSPAKVGHWWLAGGGWWRSVVGAWSLVGVGSWRLAVGGPWGCPLEKKTGFSTAALNCASFSPDSMGQDCVGGSRLLSVQWQCPLTGPPFD